MCAICSKIGNTTLVKKLVETTLIILITNDVGDHNVMFDLSFRLQPKQMMSEFHDKIKWLKFQNFAPRKFSPN